MQSEPKEDKKPTMTEEEMEMDIDDFINSDQDMPEENLDYSASEDAPSS